MCCSAHKQGLADLGGQGSELVVGQVEGAQIGQLAVCLLGLVHWHASCVSALGLGFELPQLIIASNLGTLSVMIPFLFRLRVGWGSISNRLKQKSFYYEAQQRGLFARKVTRFLGRQGTLP